MTRTYLINRERVRCQRFCASARREEEEYPSRTRTRELYGCACRTQRGGVQPQGFCKPRLSSLHDSRKITQFHCPILSELLSSRVSGNGMTEILATFPAFVGWRAAPLAVSRSRNGCSRRNSATDLEAHRTSGKVGKLRVCTKLAHRLVSRAQSAVHALALTPRRKARLVRQRHASHK